MWDFVIQSVPQTHLASKDAVLSSPPLFPGKIFRHNHNGRVLRFGVQSSLGCDGEKTGSQRHSRTVLRQVWTRGPILHCGLFRVIPSPRRIVVLWLWKAPLWRAQVFDN